MIGTKLAHYEITGHLGTGGMGEVYQATDSRLGRDVAVKLLPEVFANDADRAARFEREARVLASLNHSNIAAIHGVEESGGRKFLIMELVAGETLAERIERGPVQLDEALAIAAQVAGGLVAAHDKGIIHRDLKPANIKVTPDGQVKILDFGLAKPIEAESVNAALSQSPTLSMAATSAGVILGTAAYMSPEQARGKPVDKRSDIWAFGVVLHEMLTGKRLFEGEDVTETLAAVVMREPDLAPIPFEVRRLLAKCLEKDPRKRLRDIGDAWELLDKPVVSLAEPVTVIQKERPSKLPWIAAGVLAAALAAFAVWTFTRPITVSESAVARFTFTPPGGSSFTLRGPNAAMQAISPDGRYIAFIADGRDSGGVVSRSLWVRAVDSLDAQKLDNTENAEIPFWSPDSRHIAFSDQTKLKRISVAGGSPQTICDAAGVFEGGSWIQAGEDPTAGVILFAVQNGPIQRVSANGGVPGPVTKLESKEAGHIYPQFLPGGERFQYFARGGEKPGIYVQAVGSDERTLLLQTPGRAVFAPPDYLLYMSDNTLFAQHWDWSTLKPLSEPVTVADGVRTGAGNGRNAFSVSNGVLAYRGGAGTNLIQYRWFTRDGKPEGPGLPASAYGAIEMSPNGRQAVVQHERGSTRDLYLLEVSTGVLSQMTFSPEQEIDPVWSPDSRRVAFVVIGNKDPGVYQTVVGSGKSTLIYPGVIRLEAWTQDGLLTRGGGVNLYPAPEENATGPSTAKPRILANLTGDQFRLSPDEKWTLYSVGQGSPSEVWVAAYPSLTERRKLADGLAPYWRGDGKEIIFWNQANGFHSMEVKAGVTLSTSAPELLFSPAGAVILSNTALNYAVTADGRRFLARVDASLDRNEVEPMHVILNWPSLVK